MPKSSALVRTDEGGITAASPRTNANLSLLSGDEQLRRVERLFACPHCHRVYTAKQERKLGRAHGCFRCGACRIPVHEWTGYYDFSDWRPTLLKPKKRRSSSSPWVKLDTLAGLGNRAINGAIESSRNAHALPAKFPFPRSPDHGKNNEQANAPKADNNRGKKSLGAWRNFRSRGHFVISLLKDARQRTVEEARSVTGR